jgi:hypothetical protein
VTGFIVDPPEEDENVGETGTWIIKKRGVEGLVEAVHRIGEIDRVKCREHVLTHFTTKTMVDGYEGVYRKAVS